MWGIENPFKTFNYIYQRDESSIFNFMAIINDNKYQSFDNRSELEELLSHYPELMIKNVLVKNPNNPAILINAKLITFFIK